ncbi:type III secretion system export apparatus subunit SctR [Mitsuaria sp. GD03876]|uniref:type III secretion system export apparatus subunit SctR n=1 Tax=Mitsuaria sp. GD03876 TaxID=2975399 RepID=UPI00244CA66A|nr:type III secretion system export apparatus subunit SctR [Mitsuaria sp. GD03876]MDH0865340.1 type III secretion system export apparatus subunit SctR [Mitsuaria sp. GD03876]
MNTSGLDPISLAILLAGLTLLPLLLVCTTSYLKISVVLMIVRNALGVQQVPPTMALNGMALAATLFVMAPVLNEVVSRLPIDLPGIASSSPGAEAPARPKSARLGLADLAHAFEPMRGFMLANTLPEKRQRFVDLARHQWGESRMAAPKDSDYVVLIPCFVVSELELALKAGFVLYVPFVVIDLLLSNLLLALGMQMVSPMVVSLPLKILLFVLLDGWTRLFDGLVRSYA